MKFIQKYTGFFRNIRLLHFLYNFLQREGLKHNKSLYLKYGLQKSVYRSISHKDFLGKKGKSPWLDYIVNEKDIQGHPVYFHFPENVAPQILHWHDNGFIIWENYLNETQVDSINREIDNLLEKKEVDFNYTQRKIFNAYQQSAIIKNVIRDQHLMELLSFILDKKVIPFQTINFLKGSEQHAHSDSIHMSTFPRGYMIAAWFALEDISLEQGPLSYYPGSHLLPYITNADYNNTSTAFMLDGEANKKYEEKVAALIRENNLQKKIFTAKKGDVLIWHGNLIHGGEAMLNKDLSRKSMVAHYFAEDVIAYHEISERPAIFDIELLKD